MHRARTTTCVLIQSCQLLVCVPVHINQANLEAQAISSNFKKGQKFVSGKLVQTVAGRRRRSNQVSLSYDRVRRASSNTTKQNTTTIAATTQQNTTTIAATTTVPTTTNTTTITTTTTTATTTTPQKSTKLAFVPGDADQGMYPGSNLGDVNIADVDAVATWMNINLRCSENIEQLSKWQGGTLPQLYQKMAQDVNDGCCYRFQKQVKLVGNKVVFESLNLHECVDKVVNKKYRQTSDAHRALGNGTENWEYFVDFDFNGEVDVRDVDILLGALVAKRVLIAAPSYTDRSQLPVTVSHAPATHKFPCSIQISTSVFIPPNPTQPLAISLLYCAAQNTRGAAVKRCAKAPKELADGVQVFLALTSSHPTLQDKWKQVTAGQASSAVYTHGQGGLIRMLPGNSANAVSGSGASLGIVVKFTVNLYSNFSSSSLPELGASIVIATRAGSNSFLPTTSARYVPSASQARRPVLDSGMLAGVKSWKEKGVKLESLKKAETDGSGSSAVFTLSANNNTAFNATNACFEKNQRCNTASHFVKAPATYKSFAQCDSTSTTTTITTTTTTITTTTTTRTSTTITTTTTATTTTTITTTTVTTTTTTTVTTTTATTTTLTTTTTTTTKTVTTTTTATSTTATSTTATTTTTATSTTSTTTITTNESAIVAASGQQDGDDDGSALGWLVLLLIPCFILLLLVLRRGDDEEEEIQMQKFAPQLKQPTFQVIKSDQADPEQRTVAVTMFCEDQYSQIIYTLDGSAPVHEDGSGVPDFEDPSTMHLRSTALKVYSHAEYPSMSLGSDSPADSIHVRAIAVCSKYAAHDSGEASIVLQPRQVDKPTFYRRSDTAKLALVKLKRPDLVQKKSVPVKRGLEVVGAMFKQAETQHHPTANSEQGWQVISYEDENGGHTMKVLDNPVYEVPDEAEADPGYLTIHSHAAGPAQNDPFVSNNIDMDAMFGGGAFNAAGKRHSVKNPLAAQWNTMPITDLEQRYADEQNKEKGALQRMKNTVEGIDQEHTDASTVLDEARANMDSVLSALSNATLSDEIEIHLQTEESDCFFTAEATESSKLSVESHTITLDRSNGRKIGVRLGNADSQLAGVPIIGVQPEQQSYGKIFVGDQVVAINGKSALGFTMAQAGKLASQNSTVEFAINRTVRDVSSTNLPRFLVEKPGGKSDHETHVAKEGTMKYDSFSRPCLPPIRGTFHDHDKLCGITIHARGAKLDWRSSPAAHFHVHREQAATPTILSEQMNGGSKLQVKMTCATGETPTDIYYAIYTITGEGAKKESHGSESGKFGFLDEVPRFDSAMTANPQEIKVNYDEGGKLGVAFVGPEDHDTARDGIYVHMVHPDAPSARLLIPGMCVLSINGNDASGLSRHECATLVMPTAQGANNEFVLLSVKNDPQGYAKYAGTEMLGTATVTGGELKLYSASSPPEIDLSPLPAMTFVVRAVAVHSERCCSDLCEFRHRKESSAIPQTAPPNIVRASFLHVYHSSSVRSSLHELNRCTIGIE